MKEIVQKTLTELQGGLEGIRKEISELEIRVNERRQAFIATSGAIAGLQKALETQAKLESAIERNGDPSTPLDVNRRGDSIPFVGND